MGIVGGLGIMGVMGDLGNLGAPIIPNILIIPKPPIIPKESKGAGASAGWQ